jgi:hypothetical protein
VGSFFVANLRQGFLGKSKDFALVDTTKLGINTQMLLV